MCEKTPSKTQCHAVTITIKNWKSEECSKPRKVSLVRRRNSLKLRNWKDFSQERNTENKVSRNLNNQ